MSNARKEQSLREKHKSQLKDGEKVAAVCAIVVHFFSFLYADLSRLMGPATRGKQNCMLSGEGVCQARQKSLVQLNTKERIYERPCNLASIILEIKGRERKGLTSAAFSVWQQTEG